MKCTHRIYHKLLLFFLAAAASSTSASSSSPSAPCELTTGMCQAPIQTHPWVQWVRHHLFLLTWWLLCLQRRLGWLTRHQLYEQIRTPSHRDASTKNAPAGAGSSTLGGGRGLTGLTPFGVAEISPFLATHSSGHGPNSQYSNGSEHTGRQQHI